MINNLLILEPTPHTSEVCEILGKKLDFSQGPKTRAELLKEIGDYDALFVRLGHQIDRELLSIANRLKVIATPTTGLTHIDVNYAKELNIDILCLRNELELLKNLPATAELAWGLLLAVNRRLIIASHQTRNRIWDRDQFWSPELAGKTLGIIGLGRIGGMVASYANAFGMKVLAYDINKSVEGLGSFVDLVDKDTLIKNADVITIHAHYNQGDLPILNAADMLSIKPGCILINTARGELIDENALLENIHNDRFGGVGLDVLTNEPKPNPALLALQETHNVIITPHIGGATYESIQKTELYMAKKLRSYVQRVNHE